MAWKKTTESDDRYINTDRASWVAVVQNGDDWEIVIYAEPGGQFVVGVYSSKLLAETALTALVLTF